MTTDSNAYLKGPLSEYLDDLSLRKITPGGGSASALAASLAAGLNLMVINFTLGKDGSGDDALVQLKERQEESFSKLKSLVDEDCIVFRALMKTFSSEGDSQEAYIAAAKVPLNICRECCASIYVTSVLIEKGNMNLLTDVGGAAHLFKGAFSSAKLNVDINLKEIKDADFVNSTRSELESLEKDINEFEASISKDVEKQVLGKEE